MRSPGPSIREFFRALVVVALGATVVHATPATAQDAPVLSDSDIAQLPIGLEDLADVEPNRSWDGLGLFSDDAMRILEVAAGDVAVTPYGFGDDPSGAPVIAPTGARTERFGVMQWTLPGDWTPPSVGLTDSMAFAQTAPLAPGSDIVLVWSQFDSEFDFTAGQTLNEGVTLTIPGLPVWNSTFAGDTWEGANLIPVTTYVDGILTFDVLGYEPPQSFPALDMAAFYYRSGDIMAVALDAAALQQITDAAATEGAAAAAKGQNSNLLYTGESATVPAQNSSFLSRILFGMHLHITSGALFTPGFVVRLLTLIPTLLTLIVLTTIGFPSLLGLTPAPETSPSDDGTDDDQAKEPSTGDPPPDTDAGSDSTTETPATDPPPVSVDPGGGLWPLVLLLVGVAMILSGLALWLPAATKPTTVTKTERDEREPPPEPEPAPTAEPAQADVHTILRVIDRFNPFSYIRDFLTSKDDAPSPPPSTPTPAPTPDPGSGGLADTLNNINRINPFSWVINWHRPFSKP